MYYLMIIEYSFSRLSLILMLVLLLPKQVYCESSAANYLIFLVSCWQRQACLVRFLIQVP